jgi:hypothetical protein
MPVKGSGKTTCSICNAPRDQLKDSWCRLCRKKFINDRVQKGLCSDCGIRPIAKDEKSRCSVCLVRKWEVEKIRRRQNKLDAIEFLGGKCLDCGLVSEFISVYDFHHTDPNNKDIEVAKLMHHSWNNILIELERCILLCACCHRIRHEKEYKE